MKNKHIGIILGLVLFVFAAWVAVILLYRDRMSMIETTVWPGIIAGTVGFLVTVVSLGLESGRKGKATEDIRTLPVWYTLIYFILTMALNTAFTMLDGVLQPVFVIGNIVLFVAFATVRFFSASYVSDTENKVKQVEKKVGQTHRISAQIGVLLQCTEDPEVRKELLDLKERVDLGNNVGNDVYEALEKEILSQIYSLLKMMEQNAERALVLKKIGDIKKLWNARAAKMA